MIIEIRTAGEFFGFILAAIAVMSAFSLAHWKLFAAPIINKTLAPMIDGVAINSRILKKKFPEDYERFESDVSDERAMRGNA